MPTYFPEDSTEELPEEFYHYKLFNFSDPSIKFESEDDKWYNLVMMYMFGYFGLNSVGEAVEILMWESIKT